MATMTINVTGNPIVPCGASFQASGNIGVYELILNVGTDTGYTGITYNSLGIPDRFEVYYGDVKVADSKFVGDNITNPGNPTGGIVLDTYTLNTFTFNGTSFVPTGNTTNVTIGTEDIANNITEPTDGNGILLFNKITAQPTTLRLVVTGSPASGTTAWNLRGVCPTPEESLIVGEEKFMYVFFTEPNKANQTRSAKFILGTSPNKFYTNVLGNTNFPDFGYGVTTDYINDGVRWWRISPTGDIIDTGLI